MSGDELRRLERALAEAVRHADELAVAHDLARRRWREAARARDHLAAQLAELRAARGPRQLTVICVLCGHTWVAPAVGDCPECGGSARLRGDRP